MSVPLLEAYDYLRTEYDQYGSRLQISLNEHPEGKRTQEEIRGDWTAFKDEWDDVVKTARDRFGADVVEVVFSHMKVVHRDRAEWSKPLWKPGDPGPNPFGPS